MRSLILLFIFLTGCKSETSVIQTSGLIAEKAIVVSAREEASEIGIQIMKMGGNAFDAMIATELALAVAYPYAGNLGGGGFMVYRHANGDTGTLDYREKAPEAASKNMFLDAEGNVIPGKSTDSQMSFGIPGTVAGLFEVHKKFGSLPMKTLIQPAIELAKKGVVVTEYQLKQINTNQRAILAANGGNTLFAKNFKVGDTIKYPALAETLLRIAENGSREFYKGKTAEVFVGYVQKRGGIITMADMNNYEPKWRKPISFKYKELTITSMPPPSSGGFCLAQILKMIEPYDVKSMGHNSVKYIQLLTEAERRSYADRNFFLGDPDFVDIPMTSLLDDNYLKSRMSTFSFTKATKSEEVQHGNVEISESNETTHYSIVDPFGNSVAATTTLNGAFGSKYYCDELGFFINNQMDDFVAKPGVPNSYKLVGADANSIAPNKRMLSSMTPTIVEKNGKLFMALGTPGGSMIITSVLQTILNVYEFDMTMQEAVNAPRFHHQWLPDEIVFEPNSFAADLFNELRKKQYNITEKNNTIIGKVDAILIRSDLKLEGGADRRGDDKAAGF